MSLDTSKFNLRQLAQNAEFRRFVAEVESWLEAEREMFESTPASEVLRGRVQAVKELFVDLKGK